MRTKIWSAVWVLVLVAACTSAFASQNATISGVVYDKSVLPLANVAVELRNAERGFSRTVFTDASGGYEFAEVPPSTGYALVAKNADGAVIASAPGLKVEVADAYVLRPPLVEGMERPTGPCGPEAECPRLELRSSAVSAVISRNQLLSLPLYNRNFLALGLLTPGTHDVEAGSPLAGATFSVAGLRPSSNNFLLDGVDNVASSLNQAIPFQVNDSIQEFRVTSANADAEYGRNMGGVVNIVTRSGTNTFHGSVFGFFGNDKFNADTPLSVYNGSGFDKAMSYVDSPNNPAVPVCPLAGESDPQGRCVPGATTRYFPVYSYNQLVTLSNACTGPNCATVDRNAVINKYNSFFQPFDSKQFGLNLGAALVRDKLFVFGSYEGTRIDNPNPIFERVPSASTDRSLAGLPLAVANGPDADLAQRILALYPASNVQVVPGVLEFYRGYAPNYTDVDNLLLRFDLNKSGAWHVRYSVQKLNQLHDSTLPQTAQYPGNGAVRDALNQNLALSWTKPLSSRFILETHGAFTRFQMFETPQDVAVSSASVGIPGAQLQTFMLSGLDRRYFGAVPGNDATGGFGNWVTTVWGVPSPGGPVHTGPNILPTLDGLFPFARIGAPINAPAARRDTTWTVMQSASLSRSQHNFKFGGEFRQLQNVVVVGGFARGFVSSSNIGEFVADSETGLFSKPSFDYAIRQNEPYRGLFYSYSLAGYAQDSWRIKDSLTINLGVRYDFFTVPREDHDQLWNFDPAANGLVQQNGTMVINPFGALCTGNSDDFYTLAAVYSDRSFGRSWACKPNGDWRVGRSNRTNFAPRVGFAWAPGQQKRIVVRGAFALFYDQQPISSYAQLMLNRPTPVDLGRPQLLYGQNFNSSDCAYCGRGNETLNLSSAYSPAMQAASSPFGMYARDYQHSDTPYARQVSGSVQYQLSNKVTMELGYEGTAGENLPVVYNYGYTNEWFCTSSAGLAAGGENRTKCDPISYFPVFTLTNRGTSEYHALLYRLRAAEWHGLRINGTYSYSKAMDNVAATTFPVITSTLWNQMMAIQYFGVGNPFGVYLNNPTNTLQWARGLPLPPGVSTDTLAAAVTTTGAGQVYVTRYGLPQDPANFLHDDWGRSDFDNRHRLVLDFNWQPPYRGKSKLLSGWTVSGIVIAQTGQPYTILLGPVLGELVQRTNSLNINRNSFPSTACVADPVVGSAFATGQPLYSGVAGSACAGTTARNSFTGTTYANMDMAVQKAFTIGEGKSLVFRAEIFNLTNRENDYNPISAISLDGYSINPNYLITKSAHDPRQVQFAIRFNW
ncbi:MAG: carboxypeptidase regulatory-like domain-containing protein [Terriglobales bacterium]